MIISHDGLFSDIYQSQEIKDGLCLKVKGKMVSRTDGNTDDSLVCGNASAEGPEGEGTGSTVVTRFDVVMNLQETSFTKEGLQTGAAEQIKHILANFNNYQFFIGKNMNPDGMVALLDYCEDDVTSYMIFFKGGLEMEKC